MIIARVQICRKRKKTTDASSNCQLSNKIEIPSKRLNSKLLSIWTSYGIIPKGPLGHWAPKAPLGPCVRRRRTYAPCRDVHRTSVDDVCARCDVAENVEANKLVLYMGTGAQKLTLYMNTSPHRGESENLNLAESRPGGLRPFAGSAA